MPMTMIMAVAMPMAVAVIMTMPMAVGMMPVIVTMAVIVVMMSARHRVRGDRLAIILTQAQQIAADGPAELA